MENLREKIKLSKIQKELIKNKCPACKIGNLYAVEGNSDCLENYLWCDSCDCSVDGCGGYTD